MLAESVTPSAVAHIAALISVAVPIRAPICNLQPATWNLMGSLPLPLQQHVAPHDRSNAVRKGTKLRRSHDSVDVARVAMVGDVEYLHAEVGRTVMDRESLVDHHVGGEERRIPPAVWCAQILVALVDDGVRKARAPLHDRRHDNFRRK